MLIVILRGRVVCEMFIYSQESKLENLIFPCLVHSLKKIFSGKLHSWEWKIFKFYFHPSPWKRNVFENEKIKLPLDLKPLKIIRTTGLTLVITDHCRTAVGHHRCHFVMGIFGKKKYIVFLGMPLHTKHLWNAFLGKLFPEIVFWGMKNHFANHSPT